MAPGHVHRGRRPRRRVLPDVVAEHLEELGYLAIQARKLRFSPEFGPSALDRLDARAAAHTEALRVAGPAGVEAAGGRMGDTDPFQQYVASRAWLELGRPSPERVLARLAAAAAADHAAWREAFRRAPPELVRRVLPAGSTAGLGAALAVVVDAWAWHDVMPPGDARAFAVSPLGAVRAAVARGLARAPREAAGVVDELCRDPDPEVARRALWSTALRDPRAAADRCRRALDAGSTDAFAVQSLGLIGNAADQARIVALAESGPTRPAALRALGQLGDVAAIGPILDALASDDPEIALAASDALESILGVLPRPEGGATEHAGGLAAAAPEPIDPETGHRAWAERAPAIDPARRWSRGRPLALPADPGAYPMETLWRIAVVDPAGSPPLRAEVPDGFYEATPTFEAIVGE
jgi:hypothetical protein